MVKYYKYMVINTYYYLDEIEIEQTDYVRNLFFLDSIDFARYGATIMVKGVP